VIDKAGSSGKIAKVVEKIQETIEPDFEAIIELELAVKKEEKLDKSYI